MCCFVFSDSIFKTLSLKLCSTLPSTLPIHRIWYPGPERRIWKQRYFDAGFVFLQDMIERAVLETVTQKNITAPGVYVQEMAYPCYNEDKCVCTCVHVCAFVGVL